MKKGYSEIKCMTCNSHKIAHNGQVGYHDNLYWGILHSLNEKHEVRFYYEGKLIHIISGVSFTGQDSDFVTLFGLEYKGLFPVQGGENEYEQ